MGRNMELAAACAALGPLKGKKGDLGCTHLQAAVRVGGFVVGIINHPFQNSRVGARPLGRRRM